MEISVAIAIGVLSGVLTSGIIWLVVKILNQLLVPWYQMRIYRGVNVEDTWKGKMTTGSVSYEYELSIIQRGHVINGDMQFKNIFSSGEIISKYKVTGTITDTYLSVRYFAANKKKVGLGSLLFKITKGGEEMEGSILHLEILRTGVSCMEDITLTREK